jgi:hypothetical protein
MRQAAATILIDDSLENAVDVVSDENPPGRVLLFGSDYPWNKRNSRAETAEDMLSYEQRVAASMVDEEVTHLDEGITRVANWEAVLKELR